MVATVASCCAPASANGVSTGLLALIDEAKKREEVANAHTSGPLAEAETRTDAAVEAVPHYYELLRRGSGAASVLTTARNGGDASKYAAGPGFRAGHRRREQAMEAIRRRSAVGSLVMQNDALWEHCCIARDAVAGFLVRSPADLAHKLAFMIEHQMGDGVDWLPELLVDARTLAKMEG